MDLRVDFWSFFEDLRFLLFEPDFFEDLDLHDLFESCFVEFYDFLADFILADLRFLELEMVTVFLNL